MLVFILAITQGAIREGREGAAIEETLTLAELRAAVLAMRDMDAAMGVPIVDTPTPDANASDAIQTPDIAADTTVTSTPSKTT